MAQSKLDLKPRNRDAEHVSVATAIARIVTGADIVLSLKPEWSEELNKVAWSVDVSGEQGKLTLDGDDVMLLYMTTSDERGNPWPMQQHWVRNLYAAYITSPETTGGA
jgi:hypothetical protein